MTARKKTLFFAATAFVFLIVFVFGYTAGVYYKADTDYVAELANKETEKPPQVDFSPFWRAWRLLDEKYIPPVAIKTSTSSLEAKVKNDSVENRVWGAIEGLIKSLDDPYTVFFPPEENQLFQDDLAGNFGGVGIEIGIRDNVITVISPLKGTPADKKGILAGDKIIEIDGILTIDMSTDKAVRKIRGEKDSIVNLTIVRKGADKPIKIELVRDTITTPTIKTDSVSLVGEQTTEKTASRQAGVFVIKLYNFGNQSALVFRNALREFIDTGGNKLIIDLRGNPGGYLEASVDVASWFLPAGKVVVREKFGKNSEERIHRSRGYNIFNDNLKLAILVDKGSASASEIFAGALREHKKAMLVGEKTFGKGSVQELVPLTADTSLKITTARWFTPNGVSISENGLVPDYTVEPSKLTEEKDDSQKKTEMAEDPIMKKALEVLM